MAIWHLDLDIDAINALREKSMLAHCGVEFTAKGEDWLEARMPVDERTVQPFGILHGGASVMLAETIGSAAASLCVDPAEFRCVGLEINANHLRSVREGWVVGRGEPVHIGRRTQVWSIVIRNEEDEKVCVSRLTVANIPVR